MLKKRGESLASSNSDSNGCRADVSRAQEVSVGLHHRLRIRPRVPFNAPASLNDMAN